ncbi:MAG: glycosyltransferase family 39 protein [Verrucomicrobiia bacterium]
MPLSQLIQNLIHMLEQGVLARYLRFVLLGLVVLALVLIYDLRAYRNLATSEAMDVAQLARNLAEGKGYSTLFVRPLSLYLVQSHNGAGYVPALNDTNTPDFALIKSHPHPDLANPPVYPVVLAGLMKVLPFHFPVELKSPFWSESSRFWRYQPDFLIAVFNQILLLVVVALTFFLARKLFDVSVAWLSALLILGCELLWQFSVSGLSTMLLLVIFLGLSWCVLQIEEWARGPEPSPNRLLGLALTAGGLAGVGALTRYAFGWVIIPLAVFLFLFSGRRRGLHALAALGAFMLVFLPWVIRNYAVSGTPFGTAGYAIVEGTGLFPQFQLERSLHPDFTHVLWFRPYLSKLAGNLHTIFANDLPKLGGSWASILFLAGLLLGFRGLAARRMRYFLLMCLGVFIVVQALGRTQLSEKSPELNSENLLVLLAPLVFIYGVSFFFTFLDQMKLAVPQLRYGVMGIFVVLSCLPMILISTLMAPKVVPVVYPPYYPPDIQQTAGWMDENELLMSDVPWAVAWYGNRQCVWLTLNAQDDFFSVNDNMKPVLALYLTPETTDGKFVSDWMRAGEHSWGSFLIQVLTQNQIPQGFPLRNAPTGFLPERMFLTDRQRWKTAP